MARILVVDDSPTEMFRFKEILIKNGYEVLEATNGADGVTLALAEQPDLILMDVVMPGVNGFQATRHIARDDTTKHIPIVIVSTKDQDTDRAWGKRQGACEYLTKPIDEVELLQVIALHLKPETDSQLA
ncbi:twitching motility two-component system response regulator PilH [Acinetobacter calcoaceticus]|uniref:Twitching motility two-component system response regulator PilH n=1 Tax=Acinetobacter calcoaceticus TaxID=471 RepID=A0A4R1XQN9_ACICA|nr:twitching motility two-component system response regulator PilH [Acinetobacter calcoaceticus]